MERSAIQLAQVDQKVAENAQVAREQKIIVPLEQIKHRTDNTRELNTSHVQSLYESISVLGLLEPLVVDHRNRLLAGGHRLAAIYCLKEKNEAQFQIIFPNGGIPIRVIPFDSIEDPERALKIEVAENEQRRDYTAQEVRAIADRLLEAGYTLNSHRPKKGDKALGTALAVVIGKHRRTVSRYLNEYLQKDTDSKTMTPVIVSPETKALQKLQHNLEVLKKKIDKPNTPKLASLAKKLPSLIKLVKESIAEIQEDSHQDDC